MPNVPDDIKEINNRISALKAKKQEKSRQNEPTQMGQAFQIAIELASGTIVGICIGYSLDKWFDTNFVFLLTFTIFGSMAGLLNVARYLQRIDEKQDKE